MNKNLTELVLVVDRSGSMAGLRADAQGGINSLIKKQSKEAGECNLTLVQFDGKYEIIHDNIKVEDFKEFKLQPRGSTALLDAIGSTINSVGARLAETAEANRPGLVVFCIVTDGQENTSVEFNKAQVANLITTQTEEFNWQFTYLCGDLSSLKDGQELNFTSSTVYNKNNSKGMYNSMAGKLGRMRRSSVSGASAQSVSLENNFTEEEERGMS